MLFIASLWISAVFVIGIYFVFWVLFVSVFFLVFFAIALSACFQLMSLKYFEYHFGNFFFVSLFWNTFRRFSWQEICITLYAFVKDDFFSYIIAGKNCTFFSFKAWFLFRPIYIVDRNVGLSTFSRLFFCWYII